jgi:hypothetical protein
MRGDCGRVELVLDYSEAGPVALFLNTAAYSELHPKFGPVGVPPLNQGRRPPPSSVPAAGCSRYLHGKARPRFSPEPVWLDEWTLLLG